MSRTRFIVEVGTGLKHLGKAVTPGFYISRPSGWIGPFSSGEDARAWEGSHPETSHDDWIRDNPPEEFRIVSPEESGYAEKR